MDRTSSFWGYVNLKNKCKNCGVGTNNPSFCSRSCSSSFSNRASPKRKMQGFCYSCDRPTKTRFKFCGDCSKNDKCKDVTLAEAQYDKSHRSSCWALVRTRARRLMKLNFKYECNLCGYDKHCEVAHVNPISSFPLDTLISQVNSLDNLMYLCPNCHWELDNGCLNL